MVQHRHIRARGVADALVLAAAEYRQRQGERLNADEVARWFGWHRVTVWRHIAALEADGLLLADGSVADVEGVRGGIKVPMATMALGPLEATFLALMDTWGSLRMVRVANGYSEARQGALATFLAVTRRTIAAVIRRLQTGETVGVGKARRSGRGAELVEFLKAKRSKGAPAYVRVVPERLRRNLTPKPPPDAGGGGAPDWGDLLGIMGAARAS